MDAIKSKILALMAKTVESGCTEEEALAASQKATELLNKYEMSLSDVRIREGAVFDTSGYETQLKGRSPIDWLVTSVSFLTDTKVWIGYDQHGRIIYKYFGMESDVLIAVYITKICDWAIIWEAETYKSDPGYMYSVNRGKALKDFKISMSWRLAKRLKEMKTVQKAENASAGRDLVVVKSALVDEAFAKEHGFTIRGRNSGYTFTDAAAYHAGKAAGDRVNINPGVTTREARKEVKYG